MPIPKKELKKLQRALKKGLSLEKERINKDEIQNKVKEAEDFLKDKDGYK